MDCLTDMSSAPSPLCGDLTPVKLTFLLSDSRSGSTFVARNIHEQIEGVIVTPELNLVWAIRLINSGSTDSDAIIAALEKGRVFEALGQSSDGFSNELATADFATAIRNRIAVFVEATGETGIACVVIKKGHHAMQAEALSALFPEAQFICLHRDPRAVYESKCRTDRPYVAGETMAWSGVAGTTWRWRQYTRRLFEIEEKLGGVRVRFEDLSDDLAGALTEVARALSTVRQDGAKSPYSIAAKEASIHDGARKTQIDTVDAERWRTALAGRDITVIETLAEVEMARLGYAPVSAVGPFRRGVYLAAESMRSAARLITRAIRRRGS